MNLNKFKDLKLNVYYRGIKTITCEITDNGLIFSNKDKIVIDKNNIYLNGQLISNDPSITENELTELYKYILSKKGYKFI